VAVKLVRTVLAVLNRDDSAAFSEAELCGSETSTRRRFLLCHTSLAFAKAPDIRFFFFLQLRA
jgi:hypothetical protein